MIDQGELVIEVFLYSRVMMKLTKNRSTNALKRYFLCLLFYVSPYCLQAIVQIPSKPSHTPSLSLYIIYIPPFA